MPRSEIQFDPKVPIWQVSSFSDSVLEVVSFLPLSCAKYYTRKCSIEEFTQTWLCYSLFSVAADQLGVSW